MNGNTPIRILHVLTAMNMAGTETLLMSYYKRMNRELVQFDFAVSTNERCAYDKDIEDMGGLIFHYPLYRGYNHYSYIKWWNEFFKRHPEYLIVHGHIGSTAAIYLKIAKKYGRYAIAHSHSTKETWSLHRLIYAIYSYPTRFVADHFFGCSKQALVDRYGCKVASNSGLSEVFVNAIDAKEFIYNEKIREEVRKEYKIGPNTLIVGTVGRITLQKNPFFIVDIIGKLANSGTDFMFLWIGKGEMESKVKDEINKRKLGQYVIFAGVRHDVNRVLQAMDVFIFPSIWEGLGISCIESQAAGLPTLCSEAVQEDARISDLFIYVSLSNIDSWITQIINHKIFLRTNRYQEIVSAGYDIVKSVQKLQKYYLETYKSMISNK